jgi:hypothetical protein
MAQGSKSRIIIWTIVSILVVIAVVMLVTKPKNSGRPPINPDKLSRNYERQFGRLEKRVADAQSANPGAPAEQWAEIDKQIALGKQVLAGVAGLTEQKDLEAKRDSLLKAYAAARKVLKEITGKEDKEPAGGQ